MMEAQSPLSNRLKPHLLAHWQDCTCQTQSVRPSAQEAVAPRVNAALLEQVLDDKALQSQRLLM